MEEKDVGARRPETQSRRQKHGVGLVSVSRKLNGVENVDLLPEISIDGLDPVEPLNIRTRGRRPGVKASSKRLIGSPAT